MAPPHSTVVSNKQKQTLMKKIIFGIITLLAISCNEKPEMEFSLSAITNGFENGDLIYLDYNNISIDSTEITDNSFEFKTKLPNTPMQLWIRNKDFSNYRAFWAEDKPMTFDATKTDFRNAKIEGSETQKQDDILTQRLKTIQTEMENIENSFNESMTEIEIESVTNQYKLLENKEIITNQEFVKEFSTSIVSAFILDLYATTWGKEKTLELFDKFSSENKNSKYGKKIDSYIRLNKEPKIGDLFADFEMEKQNGKTIKLSEVKGKTILLEFWASWCGPCRVENPNLVKTYNTYKPKGFEILAVSLDTDKNNWIEAIKKDNLNWKHVSDLKGQANKAFLIYGINVIPDNFLISENGIIIGRNLRGEELNQKLSEVLE
jgi:peroxiredoxin